MVLIPNNLSDLNIKEFDIDDIKKIQDMSNIIMYSFKSEIKNFGYNEESIRMLSENVSLKRLDRTEGEQVKIANLFGAFLGFSLIHDNQDWNHKWVWSNGDVGILFSRDGEQKLIFPINRVFKHLEEGNKFSTFGFYMAANELLRESGKKQSN